MLLPVHMLPVLTHRMCCNSTGYTTAMLEGLVAMVLTSLLVAVVIERLRVKGSELRMYNWVRSEVSGVRCVQPERVLTLSHATAHGARIYRGCQEDSPHCARRLLLPRETAAVPGKRRLASAG